MGGVFHDLAGRKPRRSRQFCNVRPMAGHVLDDHGVRAASRSAAAATEAGVGGGIGIHVDQGRAQARRTMAATAPQNVRLG